MNFLAVFIFLIVIQVNLFSQKWINLLDDKLTSWDIYQSYEHHVDYHGSVPLNEHGDSIAPIGWNKNFKNVFSVTSTDSGPLLRISGETYGALVSKSEYENFHLKVKMKWGSMKWSPRKDKLMDSGICYFSQGEAGADYWRTWMLSQEMQIMEGHLGDYWNIANSAIDVKAYLPEGTMNPVASERGKFISVGTGTGTPGYVMRNSDYEKPKGEWNEIELICYNGQSIHIVNGKVVMILKNSRYHKDEKSDDRRLTDYPLTKGKLQIQSEASEVFYKKIMIKAINVLPKKYSTLFFVEI
jgi:Domain of Unknown Function (DUF1080)